MLGHAIMAARVSIGTIAAGEAEIYGGLAQHLRPSHFLALRGSVDAETALQRGDKNVMGIL